MENHNALLFSVVNKIVHIYILCVLYNYVVLEEVTYMNYSLIYHSKKKKKSMRKM